MLFQIPPTGHALHPHTKVRIGISKNPSTLRGIPADDGLRFFQIRLRVHRDVLVHRWRSRPASRASARQRHRSRPLTLRTRTLDDPSHGGGPGDRPLAARQRRFALLPIHLSWQFIGVHRNLLGLADPPRAKGLAVQVLMGLFGEGWRHKGSHKAWTTPHARTYVLHLTPDTASPSIAAVCTPLVTVWLVPPDGLAEYLSAGLGGWQRHPATTRAETAGADDGRITPGAGEYRPVHGERKRSGPVSVTGLPRCTGGVLPWPTRWRDR